MMENMKLFSTFRLTILKALSFMLLLSADFFQLIFSNIISVTLLEFKQFGSRSGPTECLQRLSAYMDLDVKKPVFGGLRTTKAQTSLHILAV